MKKNTKPFIFVQLNEINFDLVRQYVKNRHLPAFQRLLSGFDQIETFGEDEYQNLEPWIQWVSAQTGKTFEEHGVFRLGDIVTSKSLQIFEILEQAGLKVGAISPMNARNVLRSPAFFIPDPWTETPSDPSGFSCRITAMLRQTVNENSTSTVSLRSKLSIIEMILRTLNFRKTARLFRLIARSRQRSWLRPLVLDYLIHLVHLKQFRNTHPDASFVFLNAGAHIQHHYLLNSPYSSSPLRNPSWYVPPAADPVFDMIQAYDQMLGDYLALANSDVNLIVATGLTQIAYDRVKFYYRLKNHSSFLNKVGIEHCQVLPRMTRDFEVSFTDRQLTVRGIQILQDMRMKHDGRHLFGEIEDRGLSLFVTLTYPDEIHSTAKVMLGSGQEVNIFEEVAFVAIKNGMHSKKGFAFFPMGTVDPSMHSPIHVAGLFDLTLNMAGVEGRV